MYEIVKIKNLNLSAEIAMTCINLCILYLHNNNIFM